MKATSHARWIWAVLFVGIVYLAAGIIFASLAGSAGSNQIRVAWRLAAWLVSAVAFGTHIGYEHVRLRSRPVTTAVHTGLSVALGAFGLAVSASLHALTTHQHFPAFALAVWPALGGVLAFLVALAVAAVLARMLPNA
jgi:hypothetical protein